MTPSRTLGARVHEVEWRGRIAFALFQAARTAGAIFWIALAHDQDRLLPAALPEGLAERLQLAAEAGRTTGLMLIQEGRGSHAAETRWQCEPIPGPEDSTRHRWTLI